MLSQLLKAELAEREVRSIAYHMKSARFPAYKDLSGFDFATSEINESVLNNPQPAETERFSEIFCGFELQDLVGFLQKPCKFWCCHEAEETHARAG
jgi:hypothetical protein